MPSSTSSSERLTAADRPGIAQPVPERPLPPKSWLQILLGAMLLTLMLLALWEWQMREQQLVAGDLSDSPSAWAEHRRRVDAGAGQIVVVGDSRILFDTDLDQFQALTGVRPIQLALTGSNGLALLEDLAADPDFRGLAIVGISELLYFRTHIGPAQAALARYHFESPSQRSGYLIHRLLERQLAFLDDSYRLSRLLRRIDQGWRTGARSPYDEVWKISSSADDRQTWLWPRLENDRALRRQVIGAWIHDPVQAPAPALIEATLSASKIAVAQIRARGGEVLFLRPPSAFQFRMGEERYLPRTSGWDALLKTAQVAGAHFEDYPNMQGLKLPEYSHLSRACARVYTDAYVRALAALTPRLRLRSEAPAALTPGDC